MKDFMVAFSNNKENSNKHIYPHISTENNEMKTLLKTMLSFETQVYKYGSIAINYKLNDMFTTQECLEALDCLETIKYASIAINAKHLLCDYLYSGYNVSDLNLLSLIKNTNLKNILLSNETISSPNLISRQQTPEPSKTIGNKIFSFLSKQSAFSKYSNIHCGLYPTNHSSENSPQTEKDSFTSPQKNFNVPIYEAPTLLLLFSFFDRRIFKYRKKTEEILRLPPTKPDTTDADAYKIVSKIAQNVYSNFENDKALSKIYPWRFDNIFLFHKFNILLKYYDLYSNPKTLDVIIKKYNFEYNQAEQIQNTIKDIIFEDKDFIMYGLKSGYLDFMLPFNIFFQLDILAPNFEASPEDFKTTLIKAKKATSQIIDAKLYLKYRSLALPFFKDNSFSISDIEEKICDFLETNTFYHSYYLQTEFLDKFLEDNKCDNKFYSYNTIKAIIKENTKS